MALPTIGEPPLNADEHSPADTPLPDRCPHCNEGMSSRPFVALPNEQVAWVAFHCGTMIWHDGYVSQHRRCAARETRTKAGRYVS